MAAAFTMFEKFGDVCAALNEADRKELMYAICMYGMYGTEVELPYLLKAIFISLKEDIDNSKESRKRGSSGGRPRKRPGVSEDAKPGVSEDAKPVVSESEKQGVSEEAKPPVSDNAGKTESQTKPNQAKPNQTRGGEAQALQAAHPSGGGRIRGGVVPGERLRPVRVQREQVHRLLRQQGVDGRKEPNEGLEGGREELDREGLQEGGEE